jgi:hypothetical protein
MKNPAPLDFLLMTLQPSCDHSQVVASLYKIFGWFIDGDGLDQIEIYHHCYQRPRYYY